MTSIRPFPLKNEDAWVLTRPPATCPPCQYTCPKVVKECQDVTPWRHMTSNGVICHDKMDVCYLHRSHHQIFNLASPDVMTSHDLLLLWQNVQILTHLKLRKSRFSTWRPWPLNSSEILSSSTRPANFGSVCQTVQPWESSQTDRHTHTDGTDSIPSTTDAGGKNNLNIWPKKKKINVSGFLTDPGKRSRPNFFFIQKFYFISYFFAENVFACRKTSKQNIF